MSKNRKKRAAFWLVCGVLLVFQMGACSNASADDVYTVVVKKQEVKAKSRWTLSEWLETRDRMKLMDLWLALHSPSPYEFNLGGNYQLLDQSAASQNNTWEVFAGAFASIFGLEGRYEAGSLKRWFGIFNLRIFGYHDQGTNITLQGGVRGSESGSATYRNALAGVSLTIYLSRFFGVDGLFRYYFPSTPDGSGIIYSGNRYQGGAFIDFKFLRVYGNYFIEGDGVLSMRGATLGTKIYF
jgi:hypothetical protein